MDRDKKILPNTPFHIFTANGDLSRRWFVWYKSIEGKRVRVYRGINQYSTEFERYHQAQKIISQLQKEMPFAGKPLLIANCYKYIEVRALELRKKSRQTYTSRVRVFEKFYKGGSFGEAEAKLFLQHLTQTGHHATTRNAYRTFFLALFDWLRAEGFYKYPNPFQATKKLSGAKHTPYRYFQKPDIQRLKGIIQTSDPWLWLFCQCVYYLGIRPVSELRFIQGSDILWQERKILIRSEFSKNHRQQYVQIPRALFWQIEEKFFHAFPGHYLFSKSGGPGPEVLPANQMTNRHRKFLRSLGYGKGFTLYSWKHTGAIQFILNGGSIKALQLQLRHSSLEETDNYLKGLGVSDFPMIDDFPPI